MKNLQQTVSENRSSCQRLDWRSASGYQENILAAALHGADECFGTLKCGKRVGLAIVERNEKCKNNKHKSCAEWRKKPRQKRSLAAKEPPRAQ
jgi:hypothetical protein